MTLCIAVEAEVVFNLECCGELSEASARGDVPCPGTGEGEDDCGEALEGATVVRCEPAWRAGECQASVEGGVCSRGVFLIYALSLRLPCSMNKIKKNKKIPPCLATWPNHTKNSPNEKSL